MCWKSKFKGLCRLGPKCRSEAKPQRTKTRSPGVTEGRSESAPDGREGPLYRNKQSSNPGPVGWWADQQQAHSHRWILGTCALCRGNTELTTHTKESRQAGLLTGSHISKCKNRLRTGNDWVRSQWQLWFYSFSSLRVGGDEAAAIKDWSGTDWRTLVTP